MSQGRSLLCNPRLALPAICSCLTLWHIACQLGRRGFYPHRLVTLNARYCNFDHGAGTNLILARKPFRNTNSQRSRRCLSHRDSICLFRLFKSFISCHIDIFIGKLIYISLVYRNDGHGWT